MLSLCYNFSSFSLKNRTNSLPRRDPSHDGGQPYGPPSRGGSGRDFSLTRMTSLGGGSTYNNSTSASGGHWTDSLPRRDFYSNIAPTGSLPRRDKAGLGRPEPPRPPSAASVAGMPTGGSGLSSAAPSAHQPDNGMKGSNLRRRDLSLNRDNSNSLRDAFTGNKGIKLFSLYRTLFLVNKIPLFIGPFYSSCKMGHWSLRIFLILWWFWFKSLKKTFGLMLKIHVSLISSFLPL